MSIKIKLVHWLLLLTVLCSSTLIWGISDSYSVWKARNCPVVQGKIISQEPLKTFDLRKFNAPTDQVTIQIEGTENRVHSIMFRKDAEKLPETVRFHFSGNINDKVFIEGLKNPLKSNLFIFFILLAFWGLYFSRKYLLHLHILFTVSRRGIYP